MRAQFFHRAASDGIFASTKFTLYAANKKIDAIQEVLSLRRNSPPIRATTLPITVLLMVYLPDALHVYIDQESDGMYLIDDIAENSTKLSHSDFIAGDWLRSLNAKGGHEIKLVIERAHTVSASKSPAQRFTHAQWESFKKKCRAVSNERGFPIGLYGWPERTTPSARAFLYGDAEKATKDSGTHDVKAMRAYHHNRLSSINLMNLMEPRHSVPLEIYDAVEDHKQLMNFHLLRLKNHKYPESHPWMQQCQEMLPHIARQLSPEQLEMLGMSLHKRTGKLNKTFNKSRVLTLWAATHNLDGSVLTDNAGRPVGHRFLKTLMNASPFRERHCGIHRANIMRDFRANFIQHRIGKLDKSEIYTPDNHDEFIAARNEFNREWLKLAKVFREFECRQSIAA